MRLRIEATTEELSSKGRDLIQALAHRLEPFDPELVSDLEKALPHKEQTLKYPVLQKLKKITTSAYEHQLQLMLKEIDDVLLGRSLKKAFGDPPEEDEDPGEPEEKLEPGDYDPKTDTIVPEPEEEEDEEGEEEEGTEKSGCPHCGSGQSHATKGGEGRQASLDGRAATALEAIAAKRAAELIKASREVSRVNGTALYMPIKDHTEKIVEKDAAKYDEVKGKLAKHGFKPKDYNEGGRLFGLSVNELIDLLRELRDEG